MDMRLVAWARAVKSRRRWLAGAPPPLWLFTDPGRTPDPAAAVRRLPRGLCGVVFRNEAAELPAVVRACRQRRLALTVAGGHGVGGHGAAGLARHRPGGRGAGAGSASAHGAAELVRARGAGLVFLSPVFPTASHPGAPAWGVLRWAGLARRSKVSVLALGGVDGMSARRLPRWVAGAGAIGALLG